MSGSLCHLIDFEMIDHGTSPVLLECVPLCLPPSDLTTSPLCLVQRSKVELRHSHCMWSRRTTFLDVIATLVVKCAKADPYAMHTAGENGPGGYCVCA